MCQSLTGGTCIFIIIIIIISIVIIIIIGAGSAKHYRMSKNNFKTTKYLNKCWNRAEFGSESWTQVNF